LVTGNQLRRGRRSNENLGDWVILEVRRPGLLRPHRRCAQDGGDEDKKSDTHGKGSTLLPLAVGFDNSREELTWKGAVPLRRTVLRLIVVVVLIIAFLLYRSRPRNRLNVTPDAQREIERAKGR
jgi:hypothetical protein